MATIRLPADFSEFLKSLNSNEVKYLLIGGYAVGYYGYPLATGNLDVWVEIDPGNAAKIVAVLTEFGFDVPGLSVDVFLKEDKVIRMGVPPLRIEVLTSISGVVFEECYRHRTRDVIDDIETNIISLHHLKCNK